MSFQKSQTNIALLLSFTILGLVYSQITVSLKQLPYKSLYFTAPNSTYQCTTDIFFNQYGCSDLQLYRTPDIDLCLSNPRGSTNGFVFGNTLVNIQYSVWNDMSTTQRSYYFGELCIGAQKGILYQLVQQKLISKQIIYFSLFQSIGQNDIIGEANFGSPNYNQIKKGANLVYLKQVHDDKQSFVVKNRGLKYFGEQLESKDVIFTFERHHYFPRKTIVQMVQIFEQQGIPFTVEIDDFISLYAVSFPSVEKLQPIELSLTLEDNTSYNLTLQVSQYTSQRDNGSFFLAIDVSNSNYMKIGRNVFYTYYVGFDETKDAIQIAEKREENRSLRRSQNNFN